MGLPDELLDELLSAHLDDALSGDERARVEQMLQDDQTVGERLEQLRRQRELFRQAAISVPELPDGFADSVVQAAIDQARREDLPADHPLRRAERGEVVHPASEDTISTRRLVATIVGLAASLLFITLVVKQFGGGSSELKPEQAIASVPESTPGSDDVVAPDGVEVRPENGGGSDTMVAESSGGDVPDPETMVRPGPIEAEPIESESTGPEMIAESRPDPPSPTVVENPTEKLVGNPPPAPPALSLLVVIEVRQTENGRASAAFDQALVNVEIEAGDEREVDAKLVRAVAKDPSTNQVGGDEGQVVFLEAPIKKLDKLVNRLVADREGIEAIGFSMITAQLDASLMRSIESVRSSDATKVRHQGQSFPIVNQQDDVMETWINQLSDRRFAPVRGGQVAQAVSTMAAGPNPMANILFIVR